MLLDIPFLADWSKIREYRQKTNRQEQTDKNKRENNARVNWDYQFGDKVLLWKEWIICKTESRYQSNPWAKGRKYYSVDFFVILEGASFPIRWTLRMVHLLLWATMIIVIAFLPWFTCKHRSKNSLIISIQLIFLWGTYKIVLVGWSKIAQLCPTSIKSLG